MIVLSNRLALTDRELISGRIGGVDFGYNLSCIARSPTAALLWLAGTAYWSGRGSTGYGSSGLILILRTVPEQTWRNYKQLQPEGGKLTPARVIAASAEINEAFGGEPEIIEQIANAVRQKKTLLIEGGGEPFRPHRTGG